MLAGVKAADWGAAYLTSVSEQRVCLMIFSPDVERKHSSSVEDGVHSLGSEAHYIYAVQLTAQAYRIYKFNQLCLWLNCPASHLGLQSITER